MVLGYTFSLKSQSKFIVADTVGKSSNQSLPKQFSSVFSLLERRYIDTLENSHLFDVAMTSVFDELDQYSVYIPPVHTAQNDMSLSSEFLGLGVEMFFSGDTVFVTNAKHNSKAAAQGLNHGDKFISINGFPMTGDSVSYHYLRHKLLLNGKSADITYIDHQSGKEVSQTFDLETIENDDATIYTMVNDSVGLIKINSFSDKTYNQFMKSLEALDTINDLPLNLIIDLRDNSGGYLPEVTKILDQLYYKKDQLLLKTVGRDDKTQEIRSKAKNFFKVDKIAVFINQRSASASEILAGVIQDLDIGFVIGTNSYGKGLVQEQFKLSNGGQLRITTSKYLLPSGRSIQKWDNVSLVNPDCEDSTLVHHSIKYHRQMPKCEGIVPDFLVDDNDECTFDKDAFTFKMFDVNSIDQCETIKNTININGDCVDQVYTQCQYRLNKRLKGEKAATLMSLSDDPFVTLATVQMQHSLKEILRK